MPHTKSYARIGHLPDKATVQVEGDGVAKALPLGALTDEANDARRVLHRWACVAMFNVGTATTLDMLDSLRDELHDGFIADVDATAPGAQRG